jgi:dephospho-CoA kinase
MIKLGLTGNRYTGKDTVCNIFEKMTIPVFNADVILKFLLNYNADVISNIKKKIGTGIFLTGGFYDLDTIRYMGGFDKILDEAELELLKAYEKFRLKHKNTVYTIFHSSILFERHWDKNVDYVVNVCASDNDRLDRCRYLTGSCMRDMYELISTEMTDDQKNKISNYVIYNNDKDDSDSNGIYGNLLSQVQEVDQKIISKYLQNNEMVY